VRFIADIAIAGFKLMIPLFAAYIAYSIGDKPALVPALVCG
jgi:PTS system mannose-specific IIC component